jgi:hypothetical protein
MRGTKRKPVIYRRDVTAIMPHPKVTGTKIQHRRTLTINIAPMIGWRFAADRVVEILQVSIHGNLKSLRVA